MIIHLKNLDDRGSFQGYASLFHVIDTQGDMVLPGAFSKSLQSHRQKGQWPKMLWQHDTKTPIGVWTHMEEDQTGLFVKGQLLLDVDKGREAYALMNKGVVDRLSIGFTALRSHRDPVKGCRQLEEIALHEISLVTFAACPQAGVTGYKEDRSAQDLSQDEEPIWSLAAKMRCLMMASKMSEKRREK